MAKKFRLPNEMTPKSKNRVPVSARLDEETRDFLAKIAQKEGFSLSELIETVLEDYSEYLREKGYK